MPLPAAAQCNIAGAWNQTAESIGTSVWTFSPQGGNGFAVQEQGFGNATGTATVNGNAVHVEWHTNDNVDGSVYWTLTPDCNAGQGSETLANNAAPGTFPSRWRRMQDAGAAMGTPPQPGIPPQQGALPMPPFDPAPANQQPVFGPPPANQVPVTPTDPNTEMTGRPNEQPE